MNIDPPEVAKTVSDRSKTLKRRYRRSLLALGMSPDTHIFDLDYDWLCYKNTRESRFLREVVDFYLELNEVESRIFVCQVLERGRHFPFWWLGFVRQEKEYLRLYGNTLRKIDEKFYA